MIEIDSVLAGLLDAAGTDKWDDAVAAVRVAGDYLGDKGVPHAHRLSRGHHAVDVLPDGLVVRLTGDLAAGDVVASSRYLAMTGELLPVELDADGSELLSTVHLYAADSSRRRRISVRGAGRLTPRLYGDQLLVYSRDTSRQYVLRSYDCRSCARTARVDTPAWTWPASTADLVVLSKTRYQALLLDPAKLTVVASVEEPGVRVPAAALRDRSVVVHRRDDRDYLTELKPGLSIGLGSIPAGDELLTVLADGTIVTTRHDGSGVMVYRRDAFEVVAPPLPVQPFSMSAIAVTNVGQTMVRSLMGRRQTQQLSLYEPDGEPRWHLALPLANDYGSTVLCRDDSLAVLASGLGVVVVDVASGDVVHRMYEADGLNGYASGVTVLRDESPLTFLRSGAILQLHIVNI